MQKMISSNNSILDDKDSYKMIDFVQLNRQNLEPEIKKELPPEPKKQKTPPKVMEKSVSTDSKTDNVPNQTPLNIDIPSVGGMTNLSQGSPNIIVPIKIKKMDSELTPMIQIQPIYPSRAKRMGTQGYVKVQLKVDATGNVKSIKIIKSVPHGVFDRAVKRALKRWKFRPKTVDGKTISQVGSITLNFTLADEQ